jgi:hypothetical protein
MVLVLDQRIFYVDRRRGLETVDRRRGLETADGTSAARIPGLAVSVHCLKSQVDLFLPPLQPPTMFPDHLNTMVQMPSHQSWAGQQNLMNAAAHLMDQGGKDLGPGMGAGLWSTPRGPLENPLYSTSSSVMENDRLADTSFSIPLRAPWLVWNSTF